MVVQQQLGLAIQRLRRDKGLSQDELAHRAGIDQAYLSRVENGATEIGVNLLFRIAAGLAIAPAALLEDIRVEDEA